jgi:DNA polymerase-3 subunit delta'
MNEFIGQRNIVNTFSELKRKNLLGHAYLLSGPEGIGKRTLAAYISKLLLCTADAGVPCGRCNNCKSFDAGINPGFMRISPRTQNILIEQIRLILDDIAVKPSAGRKVYSIEDADRMTTQAQNCLLKTLEEPPEYAVIMMTASNPESLLTTIRSRVVQCRLARYSAAEIRRILERSGIKGANEAAVAYSDGIPGKAIKLAREGRFTQSRDMVMGFMFGDRQGGAQDFDLNRYLSKNREAFTECADIIESVFRDAMLLLAGKPEGLINSDKRDSIIEYAKRHNIQEMLSRMKALNEIRENLRYYMNYQLAVDLVTLIEQ